MASKFNQSLFDPASIMAAFKCTAEGADDYEAKTRAIEQLVRDIAPKSGDGSPEEVVAAGLCQLYVDTTNSVLYYNPTYKATTGWVAL